VFTAFVCIIGWPVAVSSWRPPPSYPCPSFACTVPFVIMLAPVGSSAIIVSGGDVFLSDCLVLGTRFRRSILLWLSVLYVVVLLGLGFRASSRPAAVVMSWLLCVDG